MADRERFGEQVADALAHFYDVTYLRAHPLADWLCPEVPDALRPMRLREILADSIEAHRPDEALPADRPEWLAYHVLSLSYVACQTPQAVGRELGLGRTSYYKYRAKGLAAVSDLLWSKHVEPQRDKAWPAASPPTAAGEASRVAAAAPRQRVPLGALLRQVEQLMTPLVRSRGRTLSVTAPPRLPAAYADPALLRQAVLGLVTTGLRHGAGDALHLLVTVHDHETHWRMSRVARNVLDHAERHAAAEPFVVSRDILAVYGGRIWAEDAGSGLVDLVFSIPTAAHPTVLVVDDDANAIRLYRHYLEAADYVVSVAQSAREAWERLATVTPDLVILDVLMPMEDGWDILQRLQLMPATRTVPVLVCSVLPQPSLALTLGAAEVLQKPFAPEQLLAIMQALLTTPPPPPSPDQPERAAPESG